jgi:hypothetical protein
VLAKSSYFDRPEVLPTVFLKFQVLWGVTPSFWKSNSGLYEGSQYFEATPALDCFFPEYEGTVTLQN